VPSLKVEVVVEELDRLKNEVFDLVSELDENGERILAGRDKLMTWKWNLI